MKNISIRKAIGLLYLGLTVLFISSIYSVYSQYPIQLEDFLEWNIKTALFVIAPLCLLSCFFSSIFWLFTQSISSRFLGYATSILILLMCVVGFTIEDYVSTVSGIALGIVVFLFFISYSRIGFPNQKEKSMNSKILDSDLFKDDNSSTNISPYFWFLHRIYAITIFSCVLPLLLQIFDDLDNLGDILGLNWVFGVILLLHMFAVFLWLKPVWGRWIAVIMMSIIFAGSLFFFFSRTFGTFQSTVIAIFGGIGLCILPLSFLLILISKEAKAELEAFEQQKKSIP